MLTENALQVAKNAFELMELSARSYHRILKVSRTIADMEGEELIHTRLSLIHISLVGDTDNGKALKERIQELKQLLDAYRKGVIKEKK